MKKPEKRRALGKHNQNVTTTAFSTGGGGTIFEACVATLYATTLLVETIPRGCQHGPIRELRSQRRYIDNEPMDDIVLILNDFESQSSSAKLALQVKYDMQWGDNTIFNDVIKACWQTFTSPSFSREFDRFGIVVGVDKASYRSYRNVLNQARNSVDATDFFNKVDKNTSQACRSFVTLMRMRINAIEVLPHAVNDDDIWQFLRKNGFAAI